jgi:hypothetical protein
LAGAASRARPLTLELHRNTDFDALLLKRGLASNDGGLLGDERSPCFIKSLLEGIKSLVYEVIESGIVELEDDLLEADFTDALLFIHLSVSFAFIMCPAATAGQN